VVEPGARVQAPLTLSLICTWPLALYWANQPTSRSPAATGWPKYRLFSARDEFPAL
jgi:hypothetical protein